MRCSRPLLDTSVMPDEPVLDEPPPQFQEPTHVRLGGSGSGVRVSQVGPSVRVKAGVESFGGADHTMCREANDVAVARITELEQQLLAADKRSAEQADALAAIEAVRTPERLQAIAAAFKSNDFEAACRQLMVYAGISDPAS